MATVGDVLREVLPSGSVRLAGQVALFRPAIARWYSACGAAWLIWRPVPWP